MSASLNDTPLPWTGLRIDWIETAGLPAKTAGESDHEWARNACNLHCDLRAMVMRLARSIDQAPMRTKRQLEDVDAAIALLGLKDI